MVSLSLEIDLKLLILVAAANSAPQVMRWASRDRAFYAIDAGIALADGRPLFGPSKTWVGLIAGILASSLAAPLLSMSVDVGLHAGIAAMAGDLLTSFLKRRLGIGSSMPAPGLDQFAEAALPLLVLRGLLPFSWLDLFAVLLVFVFGELALAKLLHRFGLRDRPI
ncbi:MAG: CDP-archaeol synthase [Proteobacteria bacterium]|nr:CDP-archaeol synthase [Pseudomonadota bacterium]